MKLFYKGKDGGSESTVTGYWLIEWKSLFSIVLLKFDKGSRDSYHTHAFNAISWYISGDVEEQFLDKPNKRWKGVNFPKYTPRGCYHRVYAYKTSWVLSFRGKWIDKWNEFLIKENKEIILTHGRKITK